MVCSLRAVTLIAGVLGKAGERGQKRRLAAAEQGEVTWQNPRDVQKFMETEAATKVAEASAAIGQAQADGILDDKPMTREDFMTDEELLAEMNELPGTQRPAA